MQFPIGLTNALGEALYVFTIPASPYLTGYPIYYQYFYAANNAPNGVGQSTNGIMTKVDV